MTVRRGLSHALHEARARGAQEGTDDAVAVTRRRPPVTATRLPESPRSARLRAVIDAAINDAFEFQDLTERRP